MERKKLSHKIEQTKYEHGSTDISLYNSEQVDIFIQYLSTTNKYAVSLNGKNENGEFVSFTIFSKERPVLHDLIKNKIIKRA